MTWKRYKDGKASELEGRRERAVADDDVKEFYLGLHGDEGEKKSFKDVKHYRRRKRWAS